MSQRPAPSRFLFGAAFAAALVVVVTSCVDAPTRSPAHRPPSHSVTAETVVLVGAGNIARCDATNDENTALLLDGIAGTVFTAGDNVRASGSMTEFQNCYDPTWGRHRARTRPAPGDLDYQTGGAAGYFGYFGAAAGEAAQGYYSYDLGAWHIVVLNSGVSMAVGSPQEMWLKADLAANATPCVLAYWHHPRFSSYGTAVRADVKPLWDALYAAGAEVVLNAHFRVYERFAPQTPDEVRDDATGIRQFTVGTGGHAVDDFGTPRPNSEVRMSGVLGVLKLTLDAGSYAWEFVPIAGQTSDESGSGTCHGRPDEPPQNQAPVARPGGPYAAVATVAFNGSGSFDPDNNVPLTYAWDFGDGTTGTGATPSKTYGADGAYTVTLMVTDALGRASTPATTTATIGNAPPAVHTLVGAGDIAVCGSSGDEQTAALLDGIAGTVITLGDNAYVDGTALEYANCYHSSWGRHRARTRPTPGNHEYHTSAAAGYFGYFGTAAGDPAEGYYSYDLGAWHVVVLNSRSGFSSSFTGTGSPQEQWLRADLAAHPTTCTVAYWHHPQFTSVAGRSTNTSIRPLWTALYEHGADLILNGHDHVYEVFAPMRPDGTADAAFGLRQITAGTGGRGHYSFGTIHSNSVVRDNSTHGVLKVTLNPTGYAWEFIPVAGGTFTHSGTGTCHGRPGGEPPPNQAPTANAGGPYAADATVIFNGAGSRDPDNNLPLTYAWNFGDGTTGTGVTPSHTYAAGSYTATLVVTDARGLASAPVSTNVAIANVAPSVNAGPDASVLPGSPFNLSATFTDPGGTTDAPWAWTIGWGDGASASGSTSALGGPIAASHTYATPGTYTVRVTVTDKDGGTGANEAVVTVTDAASAVLVGAGNIARCDAANDEQTALLLDGIAGTVVTTGDNVRASGSLTEFQNCYEPTWGQHRARTRPAPGDLDYQTAGASGYFSYFGAAAGAAGQGYYSYDLGAWHIVVLNSNISMAVASAQEQWLKADLAANQKQCVLAYWHHPRFSSYGTAVRPEVKPLWDALYAAGAEVVLNGHFRVYERFAPQTPNEVRDDATGIRQFTVGTGGHAVDAFGTPRPNSQVRAVGNYGVLKLTLGQTSYSWQFVPVAGQTFTDSGTTACH